MVAPTGTRGLWIGFLLSPVVCSGRDFWWWGVWGTGPTKGRQGEIRECSTTGSRDRRTQLATWRGQPQRLSGGNRPRLLSGRADGSVSASVRRCVGASVHVGIPEFQVQLSSHPPSHAHLGCEQCNHPPHARHAACTVHGFIPDLSPLSFARHLRHAACGMVGTLCKHASTSARVRQCVCGWCTKHVDGRLAWRAAAAGLSRFDNFIFGVS